MDQLLNAEHVDLKLIAHGIAGEIFDGARLAEARIVHQSAKRSVGSGKQRRHTSLNGCRVGHVHVDGVKTSGFEGVQVLGFTRRWKDRPTSRPEHFGGGQTDATRATGDQDRTGNRCHTHSAGDSGRGVAS